MAKSKDLISGPQLVADFQTAFIARATSQAATHEAERSESALMQELGYWSRSGYLQPSTIDQTQQDGFTRASLDAHIKKLQAQQVHAMTDMQLQMLIDMTRSAATGRKVYVNSLGSTESPIDVLWFNPRSGYRSNPLPKAKVSGVIEDVLLDKNMLLIKPARTQRLLNKELVGYVVYVISPETAEPLVTLDF